MAFAQKIISISIGTGATSGTVPASGSPFSSGSANFTFNNLRTSVHIQVTANQMATLSAKIWGLTFQDMNAISNLGRMGRKVGNNVVTVSAGDATTGISEIYRGTIDIAVADFQGATDLPLHIEAASGLYEATGLKPNPPYTTKQGNVDVAQLMQQLAGQMGLQFENNGVNTKIWNPYLFGSYRAQALKLANDAGIGVMVHDKGVMPIWQRDGGRTSIGTQVISPQTGLVGYPSYSTQGVKVRCLFRPGFQFGQTIIISGSQISNANGSWVVRNLMFDLEAFKPNGQWFVTIEAAPANQSGGSAPSVP